MTRSPRALLALLHTCRMQVLASLKEDHALAQVLKGDHNGTIRPIFPHLLPSPRVVLSADLTSMTDLLPLDLWKAVWLGVAEGLRLPEWMMWVMVLGFGPQMVKWPDGEEAVSQRGELIGLPLSWPIINIIHLWWVQSAITSAR